jgi:hypothetical protein
MIFYGYSLEDEFLGLGFELGLLKIMVLNMTFKARPI